MFSGSKRVWLVVIVLMYAVDLQAGDWQTIVPGGETRCATGTPYNFHVREGATDRLMIFFNGGGACWSADTCDVSGLEDASKREPTYRPFASSEAGNDPRAYDGAFAIDNPDNPFQDWSQIFVSYCTGDVHLGTNDHVYTREDGSEFTIYHRGRINADAALKYVYANFSWPERVFVSGGSAGAISSPIFAALLADHYKNTEVVHFAGGGGGYRLPPPTDLWRTWGVFKSLPSIFDSGRYGVTNTSLIDLYRMAAQAVPGIAFHQYDSAYDSVQEQFHAMLGEPTDLLAGLNANRADLQRTLPSFRGYTASGEFHTLLRYRELYEQSTNGVPALEWVSRIANGDNVDNVHCGADLQCR